MIAVTAAHAAGRASVAGKLALIAAGQTVAAAQGVLALFSHVRALSGTTSLRTMARAGVSVIAQIVSNPNLLAVATSRFVDATPAFRVITATAAKRSMVIRAVKHHVTDQSAFAQH